MNTMNEIESRLRELALVFGQLVYKTYDDKYIDNTTLHRYISGSRDLVFSKIRYLQKMSYSKKIPAKNK